MPDGPVKPDALKFNGHHFDGLSERQFEILNYLWPRPNRTAEIADLAGPVWRTKPGKVNRGTVDAIVFRLNAWMAKNGLPLGARIKNSHVQLYHRPGAK